MLFHFHNGMINHLNKPRRLCFACILDYTKYAFYLIFRIGVYCGIITAHFENTTADYDRMYVYDVRQDSTI